MHCLVLLGRQLEGGLADAEKETHLDWASLLCSETNVALELGIA